MSSLYFYITFAIHITCRYTNVNFSSLQEMRKLRCICMYNSTIQLDSTQTHSQSNSIESFPLSLCSLSVYRILYIYIYVINIDIQCSTTLHRVNAFTWFSMRDYHSDDVTMCSHIFIFVTVCCFSFFSLSFFLYLMCQMENKFSSHSFNASSNN